MALLLPSLIYAIFLALFSLGIAYWVLKAFNNRKIAISIGFLLIAVISGYAVWVVIDACNTCQQTDLSGMCCEWSGVGIVVYIAMAIFAAIFFVLLTRRFLPSLSKEAE